MEYLKGYRVLRDDPEWTGKLLIGSLFFLSTACIPILGQVVLSGWQALIMRRAVRGQDDPLPRLDFDMDYLGKLVGIGFKGFIVRFLWSLPAMVLAGGLFICLYFGAVFAGIAGAAGGDSGAGGLVALCCIGGGALLWLPLVVLLTIPANVAAMRAELTDDLNQGMRFKEVMDFTKAMFRPLFAGSLILMLVGTILAFVGLLAFCVGVYFVAVLGMVAQAHFMAQVYQRWVEQGGQELPIAALDVTPARPLGVPPTLGGGPGGWAPPPPPGPG